VGSRNRSVAFRSASGTRVHAWLALQVLDTDNFVVALMAEAATGRAYAQLLASDVYLPLRLRHTTLPSGFAMPRPYIHGYELETGRPPEDASTLISAAEGDWSAAGCLLAPTSYRRGRSVRGAVVDDSAGRSR
jgi:hypothetical protein